MRYLHMAHKIYVRSKNQKVKGQKEIARGGRRKEKVNVKV